MKKLGNVLWGMVFIAIGLIIAVNALGIAEVNVFFRGWWTLIIIIPCFIGFVKGPSRISNFIGIVIGVALLLSAQGFIEFSLIRELVFPFILIMIGVWFIFRDFFDAKVTKRMKELNKSGLKEYAATFSGNKINLENEVFDGADLTSAFGGLELNLVNSIINGDQIVNATAVFGGIVIKVPSNVNVKVKSTCIFAGVTNKSDKNKIENAPTIYVNAFSMFGGVDIK